MTDILWQIKVGVKSFFSRIQTTDFMGMFSMTEKHSRGLSLSAEKRPRLQQGPNIEHV